MRMKWQLPLTLAQKLAWDFCDYEHGFEFPCYFCERLAKAVEGVVEETKKLTI